MSMPNAKRGWVKTEHGWEPRREREQKIVELIRLGTPFKDIAFMFSISVPAVSYFRKRAGIPRRIGASG